MLIELYSHSIGVKRRVIDFLAGRQPNFRRPSPTIQPEPSPNCIHEFTEPSKSTGGAQGETEDERAKRLQNDLLGIQVEERHLESETKRLEIVLSWKESRESWEIENSNYQGY